MPDDTRERRPLRILHVVDSLERGGLERFAADLSEAQIGAGDAVGVFCLYRLGAITADLEALQIPVRCGDKRTGLDLRAILRLRSFVKSGKFNVVHAHNLVPNYYSAMALLGLRKSVALVNTCHDMGTRLADPKLLKLFTWSIPRTSQFAMVAEDVFERYISQGLIPANRARTIRNGIPLSTHQPSIEDRTTARRSLNIPSSALVIGCVGRLVALKNHRVAIQSVARLASEFPNVMLILIGGGVLEAELRQLTRELGVESKVLFTGERSDVRKLLPALDIFALPSLTEGMSIALIEAASAQLAIVATDVGGNPRLIANEQTGMLVSADDVDALTVTLRRLLANPALRSELGGAAREWALREASIETTERLYDGLYQEALSSR